MTPRWTSLQKFLLATVIACGFAGVTAAPAFADNDGWHGREHARHEWREHEWREHHEWHPYYYGYAPRYYPGYYAPPPVYVAPPAYVPPPVYIPPPVPSLTVVVPFH